MSVPDSAPPEGLVPMAIVTSLVSPLTRAFEMSRTSTVTSASVAPPVVPTGSMLKAT